MAWLERRPSGQYHLAFRYGDQKFKKSLRIKDAEAAESRLHRLRENTRLVESGRLTIPEDPDIATFLLSDGYVNGRRKPSSAIRTLKDLCDALLKSIPLDSSEQNILATMKTHVRHLERLLSGTLLIRERANWRWFADKRVGIPPG